MLLSLVLFSRLIFQHIPLLMELCVKTVNFCQAEMQAIYVAFIMMINVFAVYLPLNKKYYLIFITISFSSFVSSFFEKLLVLF